MTKFSANLGFLWADLSLPEAIHAAKAAGFDAVECHWPYDTPSDDVRAALEDTGLPMLGLNTRRGDVDAGENGLAALPDREVEAQSAIMEALSYAKDISARAVHVMAGFAEGKDAHTQFVRNLRMASDAAERLGIDVLIEPLNRHDAPGYFLRTTDQARDIIFEVGAPNLGLMFDCYHVGRTEGDLITRMHDLRPIIKHIQFASVPDRGTPDHGEIDYREVFCEIETLGWSTPLGAEYKPMVPTSQTLGWMQSFR